VARGRLIADLWPEAVPPTANAVLNVYLSRLRRALVDEDGRQVLLTQPAGYVLEVPREALDARRFETLLAQARRELASGQAEDASATLRDALAIWRGPALADLAFEPFAQTEIARLEELRLTALESRIEADLALGQQDVAELEALVSAHPYREGARAQLMLALYRSGRQAEALETYRSARRTFSEELGIDPGPRLRELERAILRHDVSLGAPPPESPGRHEQEARPRPRRRKPTRRAGALVALLALALAGAALIAVDRDSSGRPPVPVTLHGDSVAVIDPETNAVVAEIPVGGRPTGVAVGPGAVWVANRDDDTLLRIDPESREIVRTIGLDTQPTGVAVGFERVWVVSDRALLLVDPDVNDVVGRVRLPRRGTLGLRWNALAIGNESVWVCSCNTIRGAVARVDPDSTTILSVRNVPVGAIAAGEGALWALTGYELDTIERVDPSTGAVVGTIPSRSVGETANGYPRLLATSADAVWFATAASLWRIDIATSRFEGAVALDHTPDSLAVGPDAIWIATNDGLLLRVDPVSQKVAAHVRLGALIRPAAHGADVAVGDGAVWVAVTSLAS
jgi:YVTN family beta-propeller protein